MRALTEAFHDDAQAPTDAHDALIRAACERLDAALTREGSSLAAMRLARLAMRAWLVGAGDADARPFARPEGTSRDPGPEPGEPFWSASCADFSR